MNEEGSMRKHLSLKEVFLLLQLFQILVSADTFLRPFIFLPLVQLHKWQSLVPSVFTTSSAVGA